MVSVCLPSCKTYRLTWVSITLDVGYLFTGCSSKVQPLFLTLDEGYLLTATPPDLEHGLAPLGPPVPAQPPLLGHGATPPSCCPWPRAWDSSSWPPPLASGRGSSCLQLLHCPLTYLGILQGVTISMYTSQKIYMYMDVWAFHLSQTLLLPMP